MTSEWTTEQKTQFFKTATSFWNRAGSFCQSVREGGGKQLEETKALRFVSSVPWMAKYHKASFLTMNMFLVEIDGVPGLACFTEMPVLSKLLVRDMPCDVKCSVVMCNPESLMYPECPLAFVRSYEADVKFTQESGPAVLSLYT